MAKTTSEMVEEFRAFIDYVNEIKVIDEEIWNHPIAEGKWSIKDIMSHIMLWDKYFYEEGVEKIKLGQPLTVKHLDFDEFNANAGDERFHPDNIIWDARESNIIAITDKKTGSIVWKLGPDYSLPEVKHIGWIIGQHHAHIIPKGLPGEGNLLVFDNGGWGGYGLPNPASPYGLKHAVRDHSRVLEINPVTLEIEWEYTPAKAGFNEPTDSYRFYSPYISSAQRLPNGNTLITEGADGRLFEVTSEHEIVWEYISPYKNNFNANMVYRAYRVPYEWVPQLQKPEEVAIEPLDVANFRVPGAAQSGTNSVVEVAGTESSDSLEGALCVVSNLEVKQREDNQEE